MANPLLIDERAFDLGVYVLIRAEPSQSSGISHQSSVVSTLRAHVYDDVLLRFCTAPYVQREHGAESGAAAGDGPQVEDTAAQAEEAAQAETAAVVVGRRYTSAWEMTSLLEAGLADNVTSGRTALQRYLANRRRNHPTTGGAETGLDPATLWAAVDQLIETVLREVAPAVTAAVAPYLAHNHTLFELVSAPLSPPFIPSAGLGLGLGLGFRVRVRVGLDFCDTF